MSSAYIEVKLRAFAGSGELIGILQDGDPLGSWEGDGLIHLYWPEERWSPLVLEELKRVLAGFRIAPEEALISVSRLADRDWNAEWAASIQPIRIGRKFRIRQSWNPPDRTFEGVELVIDPGRAFGTGYHATTQLLLEWLEVHVHGSEQLLDIGTGSGILAMAGLRLGAAYALGIDIDPAAIECAKENASINGFGSELRFETAAAADLAVRGFDLVVANLDRNALMSLGRNLGSLLKRGAAALVSGLQREDIEELAAVLLNAGGEVRETKERDEWVALDLRYGKRGA